MSFKNAPHLGTAFSGSLLALPSPGVRPECQRYTIYRFQIIPQLMDRISLREPAAHADNGNRLIVNLPNAFLLASGSKATGITA